MRPTAVLLVAGWATPLPTRPWPEAKVGLDTGVDTAVPDEAEPVLEGWDLSAVGTRGPLVDPDRVCGEHAPEIVDVQATWDLVTQGGTDGLGMPQVRICTLTLHLAVEGLDVDGDLHAPQIWLRAEHGDDGVVDVPEVWTRLEVAPLGTTCGVADGTVEASLVGVEGTSTLLFDFGEAWDIELELVDAEGHVSEAVGLSTITPR